MSGIELFCRDLSHCSTIHTRMSGFLVSWNPWSRDPSALLKLARMQFSVKLTAQVRLNHRTSQAAPLHHSRLLYSSFSPFIFKRSKTRPNRGSGLRMSLCIRCSNSVLLQTQWDELQPVADESKVVHSWMKADSSPECALCQLVENEIRVVGQFEEEISALMLVSWRLNCFPESSAD